MKTGNGLRRVISGFLAFSMIFSLTAPTGVTVHADEGTSDTVTETSTTEDTTEVADKLSDAQNIIVTEEQDYVFEETTEKTTEEANTEAESEGEVEKEVERGPTEEKTEAATEQIIEETTEEKTEEKKEEPVKTFEKMYDVADLTADEIDAIDFSSCELLIATEDESIFTADTNVISGYDGVYLTKFDSAEMTRNAFTYYYDKADFVEANIEFKVSDNEDDESEETADTADLSDINNGDDAISVLNDIVEEGKSAKGTIAVIDTGIDADDLVDKVSLLGDDISDENGHGTKMYNYIREEDAEAKILSIKAMDKNGKGQVSDVYAAIQYAIEKKADIILLSISAYSTQDSEIIKAAIDDATDKGIIVVGAAGNYGKKVKYYIPGNIEKAVIAGSVDKDGYVRDFSNFGDTVDYYVVSDSTSEAAARLSGIISKAGKNFKNDTVILSDDAKFGKPDEMTEENLEEKPEEKTEEKKEDKKEDEIPQEEKTSTFEVQAYNGSGNGQKYLTYIGERYVTWGKDTYNTGKAWSEATRKFFICEGNDYAGESWNGYCVDPGLKKPDKGIYKIYEVQNYIGHVMYYMYGAPGWDTPLSVLGNKSWHQYINENLGSSEADYVTACHYLLATVAFTQELGGVGFDGYDPSYSASTTPEWITNKAVPMVQQAPSAPKGFHCYFVFSYEKNHDWQNVWGWKMSPPPYKVTLEKSSTVASDNRSLDGIKYGLYNAENKLIATYTLGANGKTKAIDIFRGEKSIASNEDAVVTEDGTLWLEWWSKEKSQNWYFKELDTNANYAVKATTKASGSGITAELPQIAVTVSQGNKTTGKASDVPVYGMIEVFKYADKDKTKPIAGAEFTVYSDANCKNVVGKMAHNDGNGRHEYTNSKGYATLTGLVPGTYYVKETKAPTGYKINEQIYTVHIQVPEGQVSWDNTYMGYVFDPKYYFSTTLTANDRKVLQLESTSAENLTANDISVMFRHFIQSGLKNEVASRPGTPYFRADQYLANRPDLATAWVNEPNKQAYNNSVNVFAAIHYCRNGAREGSMGKNMGYYTSLNEGVNHDKSISVAVLVSNTSEKYYVGIKKHDANNPNQFIAATFDIYGTNTSGATSGGTKINALSGKSTSATTGLLNVDVSDYYNTGSSTVAGKYKYFYAVETKTDSNHKITVASKALTVGKNVTYTDWSNVRPVYVTLKKTSSNPSCSNNNPNYSVAGAEYKLFKSGADASAAKSSGDYSKAIGTLTVKANGTSNVIDVTDYMNVNPTNGALLDTNFSVIETKTGKNYEMDKTVHTEKVTASNNSEANAKVFSVEDKPIDDPIDITVVKQFKDGHTEPLQGAQFTVKYYPEDTAQNYTFEQLQSKTATETKTVTSGANGKVNIVIDDNYYSLGYLTIEETKAPTGFKLDGSAVTINGAAAPAKMAFVLTGKGSATTGYEMGDAILIKDDGTRDTSAALNVNVTNQVIYSDEEIRADFTFYKENGATGQRVEGIKYEIVNVDTNEKYEFVTDKNGYFSSQASYKSHSAEGGMWFKKGVQSTSQDTPDDTMGALPYGTYRVTEIDSKGLQKEEPIEINVRQNGTVYRVFDKSKTSTSQVNSNMPLPTLKTYAAVIIDENGKPTESKTVPATSGQTIHDVCTYTNLRCNTDYTLMGTLMQVDKDGNATVFKDGNGNDVVAIKPFKTKAAYEKSLYEASGKETVVFSNLDFTDIQDTSFVVYERLYIGKLTLDDIKNNNFDTSYVGSNNDTVKFPLVHEDLKDMDQTVSTPTIGTEATSNDTTKTVTSVGEVTIVDTVEYKGLEIGKTYKLSAKLYVQPEDLTKTYTDAEIEAMAAKDKNGKFITAETEFVADKSEGSTTVTLKFNAADVTTEAVSYVVFETLYNKEGNIKFASHTVINDAPQTVYQPKIGTTAKGTEGRKELLYTQGKFIDTVSYTNLEPETLYKLVGIAMDKKTGEKLVLNGKNVKAEKEFTSVKANRKNGTAEGSWDLEFTMTEDQYEDLRGKDIVIFEALYNQEGTLVATHNDINDIGQELVVPDIHTTLTDKKTEDHIAYPEEETTLIDKVSYTNLLEGKSYVMNGTLMVKNTNKPLLDKDGKEIKASMPFTAEKGGTGTVDVEFKFDASVLNIKGETLVAFEECVPSDGKIPVGVHMDISDIEQSVKIPDGHTTATDVKTKDHITFAEEKAKIEDVVTYTNLIADGNHEYTVKGVLMDKATNKPILDKDGKEITNSIPFTPDKENGTVTVPFEFDASVLKGQSIVVFEDVYYNDHHVIIHHDINDVEQTVRIPGGHTTATDVKTGDHITLAEENAQINDEISFTNLIPGKEYKAVGVLMDKATNKPVLDKDGKEITNSVYFKPSEADGTVIVPFEFDASVLKGQRIVVFEDVYYDGKKVFMHHDIKDVDQTTTIPKGHTEAKDAQTQIKMGNAAPEAVIHDHMFYEGLLTGKDYTVKGKLMDKATNKPFLDQNGNEIISTVKFTAEQESGEVVVPFKFDASLLRGKEIVVFEDVYYEEKEVIIHHDINDEKQTVSYPDIVSKATLKNNKTFKAGEKVTVQDDVDFSNVNEGETYRIKGVLMDKATGKPFMVGGKVSTAETEFEAKETSGEVTLEFTFDSKDAGSFDVVVFEELYVVKDVDGKKTEVVVGTDKDLNNKNQTVTVYTVPKTGDTNPVLPIAGAGMVALAGAAVIIFYKKKKKNER